MPISAASSRDDQCVTPSLAGGGSSVLLTISSGSIRFGRPDRGWSSRAPGPPSAYRFRHKITVGRDPPALSAFSAFTSPCPGSSPILARCASPAGMFRDWVKARSRRLSLGGISKGGAAFGILHYAAASRKRKGTYLTQH